MRPTRNPPPFLDTDPPHWAARGLAWIVIALFLAVAAAAALVEVPETVSSRFVLVPAQGMDPVRVQEDGIVTQVLARDGAQVAKGDVLFSIRSHPGAGRSAQLGVLQQQIQGAAESLANANREYRSQRLADEEEKSRLQQRLLDLESMMALKREQLAATRKLAERYEDLQRKGYASQEATVSRQLDASRIAVDLQNAEGEHRETRSLLDKLSHEAEARRVGNRELNRRLLEETEMARIQTAALKEDVDGSDVGAVNVRAHCAGSVTRLHVKSTGAVVINGDVLCEIACSGVALEAELTVLQADVGRVKTGQGVKLLYDAFPYQRYGVRFGSLRWISPSGDGNAGEAFRALVELGDHSIFADGESRPLLAGMGGTALIVLGKRTLIGHVFEPLRALRESLAVPPNTPSHEDLGEPTDGQRR